MSGSQYIALSGLRAHVDALDRLAADIANVGTAGYKGVRDARAAAHRDVFDAALQTAIDTTSGGTRLDMTAGALASTGRPLDLALDSPGFFVVETPAGMRYTRNGHFTLNGVKQVELSNIEITAADLANFRYVMSATGAGDTLWVQAERRPLGPGLRRGVRCGHRTDAAGVP